MCMCVAATSGPGLEEGVRCPGAGVTCSFQSNVDAGSKMRSSAEAVCALNC